MLSNTTYYQNALTTLVADTVTHYQKTGTHFPLYLVVSTEVFNELIPVLHATQENGVYTLYLWMKSSFNHSRYDLHPMHLVCNELLQPYSYLLRST